MLRWLFGGIVCNQNTDFLERQASLLGAPLGGADASSRAVTIAELYDDLGCVAAPDPSSRSIDKSWSHLPAMVPLPYSLAFHATHRCHNKGSPVLIPSLENGAKSKAGVDHSKPCQVTKSAIDMRAFHIQGRMAAVPAAHGSQAQDDALGERREAALHSGAAARGEPSRCGAAQPGRGVPRGAQRSRRDVARLLRAIFTSRTVLVLDQGLSIDLSPHTVP